MQVSKNSLNKYLQALHGTFKPKMSLTSFKDDLANRLGEKSYGQFCREMDKGHKNYLLYDLVSPLSQILDTGLVEIVNVIAVCELSDSFFVQHLKSLKRAFKPGCNFHDFKEEVIRVIGFESFSSFAIGALAGNKENLNFVANPLQILAFARSMEKILDASAIEIQDELDRVFFSYREFCSYIVFQDGDQDPVAYRESQYKTFSDEFILGLDGRGFSPSPRISIFLATEGQSDESLRYMFEVSESEPLNPIRVLDLFQNGRNAFSPEGSRPVRGTFNEFSNDTDMVCQARSPRELVLRRIDEVFPNSRGRASGGITPLYKYIHSGVFINFACYYPAIIKVFNV